MLRIIKSISKEYRCNLIAVWRLLIEPVLTKEIAKLAGIAVTSLFMIISASAQSTVHWAAKGGSTGNDVALGVGHDAVGNVYTTGYFTGTATFGSHSVTSSGSNDIFIAKYDSSGTCIWAKRAGGSADDQGLGLAVDVDNHILVSGIYASNSATFGSTSINTAGSYDAFVAKYDTSGTLIWVNHGGGTNQDYGWSVASDSSGNVFVGGAFLSTSVTFSSTTVNNSGTGTYDAFIAEYDSTGAFVQIKKGGGTGDDVGYFVHAHPDGEVCLYATGRFAGTAIFGSDTVVSAGSHDMFLAHFDFGSGNWDWVVRAGGTGSDYGTCVATDDSCNAYVVGLFNGTAGFGGNNITSAGSSDVFIAKWDEAGNFVWVQKGGGTAADYGSGIEVDGNRNVYATGYISGSATFGSTNLSNSGGQDIFVAHYTSDGVSNTAVSYGGTGNEYGRTVSADDIGNVYVTGPFQSTVSFGGHSLTSYGGQDAYVFKMSISSPNDYFRSAKSGNWHDASTWQSSRDSSTWVNANTHPTYHAKTVVIQSGHTVTLTATDTIDQVVVNGTLVYGNNAGSTPVINNGSGNDLTVNGTFQDIGPNSITWGSGATWSLGSSATILRTRATNADNWRDNYSGGISTIPSTATWVVRKTGSENPKLSSMGMYYPNLTIENNFPTEWTIDTNAAFRGSYTPPQVTGNLSIGGSGTGNVNFLSQNSNSTLLTISGNLTLADSCTLRNNGTGLIINGTITTGAAALITGSPNNLAHTVSSATAYTLPLDYQEVSTFNNTTNRRYNFDLFKTSGSNAIIAVAFTNEGFDVVNRTASNTGVVDFELSLDTITTTERYRLTTTSGTITAFEVLDTETNTYEPVDEYLYTINDSALSILSRQGFVMHRAGFMGESDRNWVYQIGFGDGGAVVSEQLQYFDDLGRPTQAQSKDLESGMVMAAQSIYDAFGQASMQTLAAPIGTTLGYKSNFITTGSGNAYNYTKFDTDSKRFAPDAVDNSTANTLGYYYSNNGIENYIPTTTYPFARSYSNSNYSFGANPGADHKLGSGHESGSTAMVAGNELETVFGADSSFKVSHLSNVLHSKAYTFSDGISALKSISTDNDGKTAISYSAGGKVIATCQTGLETALSCTLSTVTSAIKYPLGINSTDIHLPATNNGSLVLAAPPYLDYGETQHQATSSDYSWKIYDLKADELMEYGILGESPTADYEWNSTTGAVTFKSTYSGKDLYLRIVLTYTDAFLATAATNEYTLLDAPVTYNLDYGQWSISYYDLAGNLLKSVSPKGLACNAGGTASMAATYAYSNLGQLVAASDPDKGTSYMTYNEEGQLRFSQNSEQVVSDKFSYVNYDVHGRAIETGEYSPVANGHYFQNYYGTAAQPTVCTACTSSATIINSLYPMNDIINDLDPLDNANCSDQHFTWYGNITTYSWQLPSWYSQAANYKQKYLMGKVSRTGNDQSITWYSYDQMGRAAFTAQQILESTFVAADTSIEATLKTLNYSYNLQNGQLTKSTYQKYENGEELSHHYTYNKNGQLKGMNISYGGSSTLHTQALYKYYLTGQLKRTELGGDLQGIDYVYTINGQLKSINNPLLNSNYDPGMDSCCGTGRSGFSPDLFGFAMDYYSGDYSRSGSGQASSCSTGTGYYSGLVAAQRWTTRATNFNYVNAVAGTGVVMETGNHFMKKFAYDKQNRLTKAEMGEYTQSSNTSTIYGSAFKEFGSGSSGLIEYDKNSNILNLKRNAYNNSTYGYEYHDLAYTYTSGTNKLNDVTDATGQDAYNATSKFDVDGLKTLSYTPLGQLKYSQAEGIDTVYYTPAGLVKRVKFSNGNYTVYKYDDRGNKLLQAEKTGTTTRVIWYISDAAGNVTAIYQMNNLQTPTSIYLKEQPLYAAGRIATLDVAGSNTITYYLSDNTGSTRVAFKDNGSGLAELTAWMDYYSFGGLMPGRNYNTQNAVYQYQGQEAAQQQPGTYNFELRTLNADLGRWNSIDPYSQFNSPYNAMGNNPVSFTDPSGGYAMSGPGSGNWHQTEPNSPHAYYNENAINYFGPNTTYGWASTATALLIQGQEDARAREAYMFFHGAEIAAAVWQEYKNYTYSYWNGWNVTEWRAKGIEPPTVEEYHAKLDEYLANPIIASGLTAQSAEVKSLADYHASNSNIVQMNAAIDVALNSSGGGTALFNSGATATAFAQYQNGTTHSQQNVGRILTLASIGGYEDKSGTMWNLSGNTLTSTTTHSISTTHNGGETGDHFTRTFTKTYNIGGSSTMWASTGGGPGPGMIIAPTIMFGFESTMIFAGRIVLAEFAPAISTAIAIYNLATSSDKDHMKGGKQKARDRNFGITDQRFWNWWHKDPNGKKHWGHDLNEDIFKDVLKDWEQLGRPGGPK